MRNIAVTTDSVRDNLTGIGVYTKTLCSGLLHKSSKLGWQFSFLDYLKNDFNKDNLVLLPSFMPIFKNISWCLTLPFRIRHMDFDYIINTDGTPHIWPFKQKEIMVIYDLSWIIYPNTHPFTRVLIYKILMKFSLDHCFKIVVPSLSTKNDLIKHFHISSSKISVIYPSLDRLSIDDQDVPYIKVPYFLYVGTIEPRKNILRLLQAFHKIIQKYPGYKLVLVGKKGWKYSEIFDYIDANNLYNNIEYLGYVPDHIKVNLYLHSIAFIYPSIYEGFGFPVLEALQYGCRVISSRTSSIVEVLGSAGVMIDPFDNNDIYNAIESVILRKPEVNIIDNYFQSEKFDKNQFIESYLQILSKSY